MSAMQPRSEGELAQRRDAAELAAHARISAAVMFGAVAVLFAAAALVVSHPVVGRVLAAAAVAGLVGAAVVLVRRYRQLVQATRALAEFADVDPESGLPGASALERALDEAIVEA